MNIKCSSIYNQMTFNTNGTQNGTGVGISSGGLGVGSFSSSISSTSQSKLAEMFSPVKNYYDDNFYPLFELFVASFFLSLGLKNASTWFLEDLIISSEFKYFLIISLNVVFLMFSFVMFISLFSKLQGTGRRKMFSEDKFVKINENYHKAYYNPEKNEIFINEKETLPATRGNFIKLLAES